MEDEKPKKERPKLRINIFVAGLMILTAVGYDLTQNGIELISVGLLGWILNPLIAFCSFLTFFIWFGLNNISFARPGKALGLGASYLIELIPFLNNLPGLTLGVIITLAMTYAEDIVAKFSEQGAKALGKVLNKTPGKPTTKTTPAVPTTPPVKINEPRGDIVRAKDGSVGRVTQTEYGRHTEWE
jgi:hypothetical protein